MKIQSIIPKKRVTIMKRPYGKRRNPKRRKFIKIFFGGSVTMQQWKKWHFQKNDFVTNFPNILKKEKLHTPT